MWIVCMAGLCLVLYTIVISRMTNMTDIIFGGADGAYVSSDSVSFLDPNATPTPIPTEDIWPKIDVTEREDHLFSIISESNRLSSAFKPTEVVPIATAKYMYFDSQYVSYLNDMIAAMKEAGFTVNVGGAYRSYSWQNKLFNGKASQIAYGMGVSDYMDPKYQDAVKEAKKITMQAGASEHQLGTCVDLMDRSYSTLIYENMNQEFFEYLDSICADYGFIKRYPTKKLLLTGWDEPWHYRYVGVEAAKFIMENGICLEEFYAHYDPNYTY